MSSFSIWRKKLIKNPLQPEVGPYHLEQKKFEVLLEELASFLRLANASLDKTNLMMFLRSSKVSIIKTKQRTIPHSDHWPRFQKKNDFTRAESTKNNSEDQDKSYLAQVEAEGDILTSVKGFCKVVLKEIPFTFEAPSSITYAHAHEPEVSQVLELWPEANNRCGRVPDDECELSDVFNLQEKGKTSKIVSVVEMDGVISLIKANSTFSRSAMNQDDGEFTLYCFRDDKLDVPFFSYKIAPGFLPVALDSIMMKSSDSPLSKTLHCLLAIKEVTIGPNFGRMTLQNVLTDSKKFRNVLFSKAELTAAQNLFKARTLPNFAELVMNVGQRFVFSRFKVDDLNWASNLKDNHIMIDVVTNTLGATTLDFCFDHDFNEEDSKISFLSQNGEWTIVSIFKVFKDDLTKSFKLEKKFESESYHMGISFSSVIFSAFNRILMAGIKLDRQKVLMVIQELDLNFDPQKETSNDRASLLSSSRLF